MVKPYITTILTAIFLAYIAFPLYKLILKRVKKQWVAALIVSILLVIVVILPFMALLNSLTNQAIVLYNTASGYLENQESLESIYNNIEQRFGVKVDIERFILTTIDGVTRVTSNFLKALPQKIFNFFIMIFMFYYLLKDGKILIEVIEKMLPLKEDVKKKLLTGCQDVTNGVVYGFLLTAMMQGFIAGIGFAIFGVTSPIFWGFMTAIFALIPFVGATVIWLPAGLFLLGKGIVFNDGWFIFKGIGLLIYGATAVSTLDNFIRPKLISGKVQIHPVIILLGILGGISLFGFIGIFIGPVILSLFLTLLKIYSDDYGI